MLERVINHKEMTNTKAEQRKSEKLAADRLPGLGRWGCSSPAETDRERRDRSQETEGTGQLSKGTARVQTVHRPTPVRCTPFLPVPRRTNEQARERDRNGKDREDRTALTHRNEMAGHHRKSSGPNSRTGDTRRTVGAMPRAGGRAQEARDATRGRSSAHREGTGTGT
jgi:hypothetical protein